MNKIEIVAVIVLVLILFADPMDLFKSQELEGYNIEGNTAGIAILDAEINPGCSTSDARSDRFCMTDEEKDRAEKLELFDTKVYLLDLDETQTQAVKKILAYVLEDYTINLKEIAFINYQVDHGGAGGYYDPITTNQVVIPMWGFGQLDYFTEGALIDNTCHEIAHTLLHSQNSDFVVNGTISHSNIYSLGYVSFCTLDYHELKGLITGIEYDAVLNAIGKEDETYVVPLEQKVVEVNVWRF